MKSFWEFEAFVLAQLPSKRDYRGRSNSYERSIRIARAWRAGTSNNFFATITMHKHDRFSIKTKHGTKTIYSNMMLEQELLVLFTLDRMGAL